MFRQTARSSGSTAAAAWRGERSAGYKLSQDVCYTYGVLGGESSWFCGLLARENIADMDVQLLVPWQVFISAALLGAAGGLSSLLRTRVDLTARVLVSAVLTSSLCGLTVALLGVHLTDGAADVWVLLGSSSIAGLTGSPTLLLLTNFVKGGASLEVRFRTTPPGSKQSEVSDKNGEQ